MRVSSHNITSLGANEVFVFGSNESGKHGKGAAKTAMRWGAKYGQGEGLQGKTYGIPTVNSRITSALSISRITKYVKRFIEFAKAHPEYKFLVTAIGCNLAGYKPKDIAPLFKEALIVENIYLPQQFLTILMEDKYS